MASWIASTNPRFFGLGNTLAEAFQPTIDLARHLAVRVVEAVQNVLHGAAFGRDVKVFKRHQLGDRETVVAFDQAQLLARPVDTGLAVGTLGGDPGRGEVAAVPSVVLFLDAVGPGDLQRLHGDDIPLAQAARDLGCRHDGGRCAIAHATAIVKPERVGDQRRIQHVGLGNGALQMGLGVPDAVGVALDRDVCHRAREFVPAEVVFGTVSRGELGEAARCRQIWSPQRGARAGIEAGEAAETGVLQLLDTQSERNVASARCNGIDGGAEGIGP